MKSTRILNGYRVLYRPKHPRAMTSRTWKGYVYEHIIVAEASIGRSLNDNEEVHHLNGDRCNNRISNLLVLEHGQHSKLHAWINAGSPGADVMRGRGVGSSVKSLFGPPKFCEICDATLQHKQAKRCSSECNNAAVVRCDKPTINQLVRDCAEMSVSAVGRKYGVTDNAIRKWFRGYGVNPPTRKTT